MKLSQLIVEDKDIDFPDSYELHRDLKNRYNNYPSHVKQWVRTQFHKVSNPNRYEESIIDAADYYVDKIKDNRFQKIISSYTPSPKNILTLSFDDIKQAQSKYDALYEAPSKRSKKKQNKSQHVTELVNDDTIRILKIEKGNDIDGAASILADMARGTKWCVTSKKLGAEYLEDGPLFLIFDKDGSLLWDHNAKFLCHPASQQFMDEKDEPFYVYNDRVFKLLHKYIDNIGFIYQGDNLEFRKYNPESAYLYALTELGGRWREAEPYIITSAEYAYKYALNIIKKPYTNKEAKEVIMKSDYNVPYAINILKNRWPEAEPFILSGDTGDLIEYSSKLFENHRWPEAEPIILKHPAYIIEYCRVIGRWQKAEEVLLNLIHSVDQQHSFKTALLCYWLRLYAMEVIKGRWPEAEKILNEYKDNPNSEKYFEWASNL